MQDKFERIGNSLIYYGKHNDRVYIMEVFDEDFDEVIKKADNLAEIGNYTKIFGKVSGKYEEELKKEGYLVEAEIKDFYKGGESCLFVGKFLNEERKAEKDKNEVKDVLKKTRKKEVQEVLAPLPPFYKIRELFLEDCVEMAEVYKNVFSSYPFPIFNPEYLKETMKDNIDYTGVFYKNKLISIASTEKYPESKSVEMTDFATLEEFRGNGLGLYLLKNMEDRIKKTGRYNILYTIARALSYGMNITFKKASYNFGGTLLNNTNISGKIESMNVWYKSI